MYGGVDPWGLFGGGGGWEGPLIDIAAGREPDFDFGPKRSPTLEMVKHYYFGGGKDYHLNAEDRSTVRSHKGLSAWQDQYEQSVVSTAEKERFNLTCDNNEVTKTYNSHTVEKFRKKIFALGDVKILVTATCKIKLWGCACNPYDGKMYPDSYTVSCRFDYSFDEWFSDVLDDGNRWKGDQEAGGTPFRVIYEWTRHEEKSGNMPRPF